MSNRMDLETIRAEGVGMTLEEAKKNVYANLRKDYPMGFVIVNNISETLTKKPKEAGLVSTADNTVPGTKKWVTKYTLIVKSSSGETRELDEKFDTQGPALKKAREICLDEQSMVALKISKELDKDSEILKILTPKNAKLGKWIFELEISFKI